MPNWLNNLETVTSHQQIEGMAQSDYYQFHLPQLHNHAQSPTNRTELVYKLPDDC